MSVRAAAKQVKKYFLGFQERWLKSNARLKIWEKSRRIGATYTQSYEDVKDCVETAKLPVWFSSADESAAKEYILYCEQWAKLYNLAAQSLGEVVIDSKNDIKAFVIEFANGARINALRSNPKAFRSKGGKVVIDEYGFHDDPDGLWKAAKPCITWGYPMRILSTHNGRTGRYYRMVEDAKQGRGGFELHTTDIYKAVEEGLVDKIMGRPTTAAERKAWLDAEQESCQDIDTWNQEYCCIPVDEATAFLTYELIGSCETVIELLESFAGFSGDLYLGMDIGRKKDLSIIWLYEKVGDVLWTRAVKVMEKTPFRMQKEVLFSLLPLVRRACIDATGLGMQLAEEAQEQFGEFKVEAITFTGPVKEELAFGFLRRFQDRTIRIPTDRETREDFHSVRKVTTAAGNIRFDAARSEQGHADRFWAAALGSHAAGNSGPPAYGGRDPEKGEVQPERKRFLDRFRRPDRQKAVSGMASAA